MSEQTQQYREFMPSTLGTWPVGVQMQARGTWVHLRHELIGQRITDADMAQCKDSKFRVPFQPESTTDQLQPNCEWVPAGGLIYPDDFEIKKGTRRFAESLGYQWVPAKKHRWQREKSRDPFLPAIEAKIAKLLTKDNERLRWERRTAKRQYAEVLGRILEQLKGGE